MTLPFKKLNLTEYFFIKDMITYGLIFKHLQLEGNKLEILYQHLFNWSNKIFSDNYLHSK
jgi:hypothetical protein